jgi:hypothetical protein
MDWKIFMLSVDWTAVITAILVFLVGLLLVWVKKGIDVLKKELMDGRDSRLSVKESLLRDKRIQERIVEARICFNSDRSYVFQFHNGTYFNTRLPNWKLTCTHESCRAGVEYENTKMKDFPCTNVIDALLPLFGEKVQGATPIPIHKPHDTRDGIYWFNILEMEDTLTTSILKDQGLKHMMLSPLVSLTDGKIVGLVGLDFCKKTSIPENSEEFHDFVTAISYDLTKIDPKVVPIKGEKK